MPVWSSTAYWHFGQELSSCCDGQLFNHNRHGPKSGGCPFNGGADSPSNTMAPGPRPTKWHPDSSDRSATITNVTERQTGQWSDSIGQTVLQTLAQKIVKGEVCCTEIYVIFIQKICICSLNILQHQGISPDHRLCREHNALITGLCSLTRHNGTGTSTL